MLDKTVGQTFGFSKEMMEWSAQKTGIDIKAAKDKAAKEKATKAASGTTMIPLLTQLLPERIVPFVSRAHWVQTLEDCAGCNDTQARPVRQVLCKKSTYPCVDNFDTADIALKILGTL